MVDACFSNEEKRGGGGVEVKFRGCSGFSYRVKLNTCTVILVWRYLTRVEAINPLSSYVAYIRHE